MSKRRNEALAQDILSLLQKNEMWIDTRIFFNGKAFATDNGAKEYRYNGEPFVLEPINPVDYFEYAASPDKHILSMSFEGPLYEVINYGLDHRFADQFQELFRKHGVYYELGHPWTLTCYDI